MKIFKLTAPNKLHLLGDHMAYYFGRTVTTSINLKTTLIFKELPVSQTEESNIKIECPKIELIYNISLREFQEHLQSYSDGHQKDNFKQFIATHYTLGRAEIMFAFYDLFCNINADEHINLRPFSIHINTEIAMDPYECLGSIAVCFAAAFLKWSYLQKGVRTTFNNNDIEKISQYTSKCKEDNDKFPTADSIVCTFGYKTVVHRSHEISHEPENKSHEIIEVPPYTILLVDTGNINPGAGAETRVRDHLNRNFEFGICLLSSISDTTASAPNVFKTLCEIRNDRKLGHSMKDAYISIQHKIIRNLINTNQQSLRCLDVPHFKQNRVCDIAERRNATAKCTTGLERRYVYVWCPPDMTPRSIEDLTNELKVNRCYVALTNISCNVGVQMVGVEWS